MTTEEKRMEKMLFNYKTMTATDFNLFNREKMSLPPYEKRYYIKPPKKQKCHDPLKDLQTINDFKDGVYVPFTIWIKHNEITRKDPNKIQETFAKPKDDELEQVIRTRPRVHMMPAISLDDIVDSEQREKLIKATYTSNMRMGLEECAAKAFPGDTLKAPLSERPAPVRAITLPRLNSSYVCPSWRMTSMKWDKHQLRSYVEPTTEFWIRRPITPCTICMETKARETARLQRLRNNILVSK